MFNSLCNKLGLIGLWSSTSFFFVNGGFPQKENIGWQNNFVYHGNPNNEVWKRSHLIETRFKVKFIFLYNDICYWRMTYMYLVYLSISPNMFKLLRMVCFTWRLEMSTCTSFPLFVSLKGQYFYMIHNIKRIITTHLLGNFRNTA